MSGALCHGSQPSLERAKLTGYIGRNRIGYTLSFCAGRMEDACALTLTYA